MQMLVDWYSTCFVVFKNWVGYYMVEKGIEIVFRERQAAMQAVENPLQYVYSFETDIIRPCF